MAKKVTHGGKRKGAGRKPRESPLSTLSVKLEPEEMARFRAICKAQSKSQARMIGEWINRDASPDKRTRMNEKPTQPDPTSEHPSGEMSDAISCSMGESVLESMDFDDRHGYFTPSMIIDVDGGVDFTFEGMGLQK